MSRRSPELDALLHRVCIDDNDRPPYLASPFQNEERRWKLLLR